MGKNAKIIKLQQQIEELEARLASADNTQAPVVVEPPKKQAKTSVNVYFDGEFVNALTEGTVTESRDGSSKRSKKTGKAKAKRKSKITFWGFIKGFFKTLFVLIIIAVVLAIVTLVAMAVVWLLVNFNVITSDANRLVELLWRGLGWLFNLFGRTTIPMI